MRPLAEDVYSLTLDCGGTISTQHGTGLARTPWVPRQYGRLYPVFVALKSVFDPNELLNPGKIVSAVLNRPAWPLRTFPQPPAERTLADHSRVLSPDRNGHRFQYPSRCFERATSRVAELSEA